MSKTNVAVNLRTARRRLEEIPEITILDDLVWDDHFEVFYIHLSIDLGQSYERIPRMTEWYITADANYPYGNIDIYPSAHNSIIDTYPHQSNNACISKNGLWRSGKLCVNLVIRSLGIQAFSKEPRDSNDRLYWYASRAVMWLRAAATNTLIQDMDLFEIPSFKEKLLFNDQKVVFAYNEDMASLFNWEAAPSYGIAKSYQKQHQGVSIITVQGYWTTNHQSVYLPRWGQEFNCQDDREILDALWIKLEAPPVMRVWQTPTTLAELSEVCQMQGIDFWSLLRNFAPCARDNNRHLLLVGYPIPKRIGEENMQMAWQGLLLPRLSNRHINTPRFQSGQKQRNWKLKLQGRDGAPKGFRPNETGWWRNDRENILPDDLELDWLYSQNWGGRAISLRGRLEKEIIAHNVMLIGCGSIGSAVAELLVRAGVTRLTCMDGDMLDIGNLCRHTLTTKHLCAYKSDSLAKRLNQANPNADVQSIPHALELNQYGMLNEELDKYDLIIDTTGEDTVLELLSAYPYKKNKVFCTISIGLGAKHLYLGMLRTKSPSFHSFFQLCKPYIDADGEKYDVNDLPRDGIGCWHPAFPACIDDIWLATSTAIKCLRNFVCSPEYMRLAVLEQLDRSGISAGFEPVKVIKNADD
ncbi:HesA/MoeB/ThiF family protein [Agathobaculum sp.]|uniref:HesA/MoeB/ThiF family protein n=1 Tax=Agathobaculum sp. TaxID=2048138 RepID=UPI002A817056|nr:ThiF family adenylyltransferase [Agathobaculum sp.]MDY3618787.1 ThiF family adenylyltransferase [Agathobaculum sp.]